MPIRTFYVLCGLLLSLSTLIAAEVEPSAPNDSSSTAPVPLQLLSNEVLLKKASDLLQKTESKHLAQIRICATAEVLYQAAYQTTQQFNLPESPPELESTYELAPIEAHINTHKDYLEQQKALLELLKHEEQQLQAKNLDNSDLLASFDHYLATLDTLKNYLMEIKLRVNDKSLLLDDVPPHLTQETLATKQTEIMTAQKKSIELGNQGFSQLDELNQQLNILSANMSHTEDTVKTLQASYAQAQKRAGIQTEYIDKNIKQLSIVLRNMQEEKVWLQGSYQLSKQNMMQSYQDFKFSELENTLLNAVELKKWNITVRQNKKNDDNALQENQELLNYLSVKIKAEKHYKISAQEVIQYEKIFHGDSQVLNQHFFKMLVLLDVIQQKITEHQNDNEKMSNAIVLTQQQIDDITQQKLDIHEQKILTKENKNTANTALKQLLQNEQKLVLEHTQVKEHLLYMEKLVTSNQEVKRWEQKLVDLPLQETLNEFEKTDTQLQQSQKTLKAQKSELDMAHTQAEKTEEEMNRLQVPFTQDSIEKLLNRKEFLLQKLYAMAHLKYEHEGGAVSQTDASNGNKQTPPSLSSTDTVNAEEDSSQTIENYLEKETAYEKKLSTLATVLTDYGKTYTVLIEQSDHSILKMTSYIDTLNKTRALLMYRYAIAVALKKYLGQNKLSPEKAPKNISEALQDKELEALNAKLLEYEALKISAQDNLEILKKANIDLTPVLDAIAKAQGKLGIRIDLLKGIRHFQEELSQISHHKNLSEMKKQAMEHSATRQMRHDDETADILLTLLPSKDNEGLTRLLKSYYLELSGLEEQEVNFKRQKSKWNYLLQITKQEEDSLQQLIAVLKGNAEIITIEKESYWVTIQAQLMPEQADTLLSEFAARTGVHLQLPIPLSTEQDKIAVIKDVVEQLFNIEVTLMTQKRWIELFSTRLSSKLPTSQVNYHNKLGEIGARLSSLDRRQKQLMGFPRSELDQVPEEQKPKTPVEMEQYLHGEVGVLRKERHQVLIQDSIKVGIKILIILFFAWLFSWLAKRFINSVLNTKNTDQNQHLLMAVSFLSVFIKIGIWILAIMMILGSLGFQIGAILAGLGIGGLAIAMAAKETLSNILGGIMIFLERLFAIGDVIQVTGMDPATVVDMTWRTTRLKNGQGYYISVPNMQLSEASIINFTRLSPIADNVLVRLSYEYPPKEVMHQIHQALLKCSDILQDPTPCVSMEGLEPTATNQAVIATYKAQWFTEQYQKRLAARDQVWQQIWQQLTMVNILPLDAHSEDVSISEN